MHNIYNLLQYYDFLIILLFLQIRIVMKEVGVGNILFVGLYIYIYIYIFTIYTIYYALFSVPLPIVNWRWSNFLVPHRSSFSGIPSSKR